MVVCCLSLSPASLYQQLQPGASFRSTYLPTHPQSHQHDCVPKHIGLTALRSHLQMNYPNMTTTGLQHSAVSLPPISSIDFRVHAAHHSPQDIVQPLPPPPPPRQLPPLPYYHNGGRIPQQPEYVQQRAIYPGMHVPSPYQLVSSRMPLPSTSDPSLIVAPARHKTKEVKRRTKTGCLTCRKRRIKVSETFVFNRIVIQLSKNVSPTGSGQVRACHFDI